MTPALAVSRNVIAGEGSLIPPQTNLSPASQANRAGDRARGDAVACVRVLSSREREGIWQTQPRRSEIEKDNGF